MTDPTRIYLVDDHPIVRAGLRTLLGAHADMLVVGEAADGDSALRDVARASPHVVVMDVALPEMALVTARILERVPHVKVLALSASEDHGAVLDLMNAGATGYLLNRAASEDLLCAIRVVSSGGVYLDPSVRAHVCVGERELHGPRTRLSDREEAVLRGIAHGHAMKEIAATLHVSTRTLETYRARAMEKLGLKSRAEIIQYALRHGWLNSR